MAHCIGCRWALIAVLAALASCSRGAPDARHQTQTLLTTKGAAAIWSLEATAPATPLTASLNFGVDATFVAGDFDADGEPDVLRYSISTGNVDLWSLAPTNTLVAKGPPVAYGLGKKFYPGHFSGSVGTEVVQYDYASGEILLRRYRSSDGQLDDVTSVLNVGNEGRVVVGDFDGNGRDEFFLYKVETGLGQVWSYDPALTNFKALGPALTYYPQLEWITGAFRTVGKQQLLSIDRMRTEYRLHGFDASTGQMPPDGVQFGYINSPGNRVVVAGNFDNEPLDEAFEFNPADGRGVTRKIRLADGTLDNISPAVDYADTLGLGAIELFRVRPRGATTDAVLSYKELSGQARILRFATDKLVPDATTSDFGLKQKVIPLASAGAPSRVLVHSGFDSGANMVSNSSFTNGIEGWTKYLYDSNTSTFQDQLATLTHLPNGGRDGTGGMRVTMVAPPNVQLNAYASGVSPLFAQGIPANVATRISLWARTTSTTPQLLQANRFWGGKSDVTHTIDSQWRQYVFNFYMPHSSEVLLNLQSPIHSERAIPGEFEIDDVEITPLTLCAEAFPAHVGRELNCALDIGNAANFLDRYWVSFEAKAPTNTIIRVAGHAGVYLGEPEVTVTPEWQGHRVRVSLVRGTAPLSFRAMAAPNQFDQSPAANKSFNVRNIRIERATDCDEAPDATNLISNGRFTCDRRGWWPHALEQAYPDRYAPEFLPMRLENDPSRAPGSQGILVTRSLPTPPKGFYTHTHGAGVKLAEPILKGSWFRVAFDSKRTDPAGSPYLRFNRLWGGTTGPNTVVLKDWWQHYELLAHEDYDSNDYLFVLHPRADKKSVIEVPAPGEFALDDVRLEALPTCGPGLDAERNSIIHCMPSLVPAPSNLLKMTFTAQLLSGSPQMRVTGPWGANAGPAEVTLDTIPQTYTVYVRPLEDEFGAKPLSFRLWESSFGPWADEAAPGRFRVWDVSTEEVPGCDHNAGVDSLALNSTFACDLSGWQPARWDSTSASWRSESVTIARVSSGADHPHALRVNVAPAPMGVVTEIANPAGVAMLFQETQPNGKWLRVSFDVRRADPLGTRFLRLLRIGPDEGDTTLEISDSWERRSIAIRITHADDRLYFSTIKSFSQLQPVPGAFELDNVEVEALPRCDTGLDGDYSEEVVCELPEALKGKQNLTAHFEARSIAGETAFRITAVKGDEIGGKSGKLTNDWVTHDLTLRQAPPWDIISLRLANERNSGFVFGRTAGRFGLRGMTMSQGEACSSVVAQSNLASNGSFDCDLDGWYGVIFDHPTTNAAEGEQHWRSDLIHIARETSDVPPGSPGALRVSIDDAATAVPAYDFTSGALMFLKSAFPADSRVRVSFDAKTVAGSPNLKFTRMWGGFPIGNMFPLTSQWQHFEGTFTDPYGASAYTFSLNTSALADGSHSVVGGTFLLDNVVIEVVQACGVGTPDGAACDDGSACSLSDRCAAGACTGQAVLCADSGSCTDDSCVPTLGCVFTPNPSGAQCCAGVVTGQRLTVPPQSQIFKENAEECSDSWATPDGQPPTYTTDADWARCSPQAGGRVTMLSGTAPLSSSWFRPIRVTPGLPYCLSVALRWASGPRPFVATQTFAQEGGTGTQRMLIGPSVSDGLGGTSVALAPQGSGWAYYKKAMTFPGGVQWIQLESGLDASATKGGEGGSAFDDVQLVQAACP